MRQKCYLALNYGIIKTGRSRERRLCSVFQKKSVGNDRKRTGSIAGQTDFHDISGSAYFAESGFYSGKSDYGKYLYAHEVAEEAFLECAALFAPVLAPYDLDAISEPFVTAHCREFLLGTDQIGRDVLSRLLYGMRISLLVKILATAISTMIGVVLGLFAGYFGGAADMIIMRFTDMVMSFPYILLVLVAASIFEPGLWSIILILGFVDWPGIARLVRGNVLSLRETNFVKGSLVAGMPLHQKVRNSCR